MNTIRGLIVGIVLEILLFLGSICWLFVRPYGNDDFFALGGSLLLSIGGFWILPCIGAFIGFIIDVVNRVN